MKGRLWKKTAALLLAVLLVTGCIPIQPIADLAKEFSLTAYAAHCYGIWYDWNDKVLHSEMIYSNLEDYPPADAYSEIPTRDDDDNYSYVFSSWKVINTIPLGSDEYEVQSCWKYYKAQYTAIPHIAQDSNTYNINTAKGWDYFCDLLADNDSTYFKDKTVLLGADISVNRIAGSSNHDFTGTFDGQGHTLTVEYGSSGDPLTQDKAAPFANVKDGCTIKNLHTAGKIYTSGKYAGGIIGTQYSTTTVENCRSSVVIYSSTNGDGTHGGFVGNNGSNASLTIEGCLFDGKLLTVGNNATTKSSGFVGYEVASVTITDSIYAPAALSNGETEITSESSTFVRNGSVGDSCYYTRTLGAAQGVQAHTISAGENVTIDYGTVKKEYSVSGITTYKNNTGIKCGDKFYSKENENVSFTLGFTGTVPDNYIGCRYTANADSFTDSTLTMPDHDVTIRAQFTPDQSQFSQDNENTYTIHNAAGWDRFCELLADNDKGFFTGKTVLLDADISVTTMAGGSYHDFTGTFDGQGHELTVAYGSQSSPLAGDKVAPFRNVEDGCVIKDLRTSGTIYTSGRYAGGVVGMQYSTVTVENCLSSVVIKSSKDGNAMHGGIVAYNGSSMLTITGCLFNGKILSVGSNPTNDCGGILGHANNYDTYSISDCVYAPAALDEGETEVYDSSGTIVNDGSLYTRCYYTRYLYLPQGKQLRTITGEQDVTVDIGGTLKEYNVSGLTFTEGKDGVKFGGTVYGGHNDSVTLSLGYSGTEADSYGFTASAGNFYKSGNNYILRLPNQDVTILLCDLEDDGKPPAVNYILSDGTIQKANPVELTGDEPTTYENGNTYLDLSSGWYVVKKDITYSKVTLRPKGTVRIILCDGCTLTLNNKSSEHDGIKGTSNDLYIYGQSLDPATAGTLKYEGNGINGIYVNNYTQESGNVVLRVDAANSNSNTRNGIHVGKAITLNGGKLDINVDQTYGYGLRATTGVTINGGQLDSITGSSGCGVYSFSSNYTSITLGASRFTDYIKATNFEGIVSVKEGQTLTDGTNLYTGTPDDDEISSMANQKLIRAYLVTVDDNTPHGKIEADKNYVIADAQDKTVTLTVEPDTGCKLKTLTVKDENDKDVTVTNNQFTMPESNVNVTAEFGYNYYNITVQETQNGSVSADKASAHYNDTVTLTVKPDTGYKLKKLTVKDADGNDLTVTNNQFKMPIKDVTITAEFELINYTVTVSETQNGTVTVDKNPAHYNDTVTLSCSIDTGYEIKSIKYNDTEITPTNGVYSFEMPPENVVITAVIDVESYFTASTGTLTLKGNVPNRSDGNGIVLPRGVSKNDVKHIDVDASGAVLPADSSNLFFTFDKTESIDLERADTSGVTSMGYMFFGCTSLESLDLSAFDTSSVKYMNNMFCCCTALTSFDLSSFNTSSVTNMSSMFAGCSALTTLDLSSFDTRKVVDMGSIFGTYTRYDGLNYIYYSLDNLTTIYVGRNWSTANLSGYYSSLHLFYGCTKLTGGAGTKCDGEINTDARYAHIDGGESDPGYLSKYTITVTAAEHGTVTVNDIDNIFPGETVTFTVSCDTGYEIKSVKYNDTEITPTNGVYSFEMPPENVVITAVIDVESYFTAATGTLTLKGTLLKESGLKGSIVLPRGVSKEDVEHIDVDASGAVFPNDSTYLFYDFENAESIDLTHAVTTNVTDMGHMFYFCSSLKSIDLSVIDTSKVTDMAWMFAYCESLESFSFSGLDTGSVTDMSGIFEICTSLTSIDLSDINTSKVTEMDYMFRGCRSLESLDLSYLDTGSVMNMDNMFDLCTSLTSLDLSSFDTSSVGSMGNMFAGCTALTSLDLSSFDTSSVGSMGNMFAGCTALTSLDLSSFDTSSVGSMFNMFAGCKSLASLDLSSFDTSSVEEMDFMFAGCTALTSLDLSSFDTSSVMSMGNMFGCYNCYDIYQNLYIDCYPENLTTIYVGRNWSTKNVQYSSDMFEGCKKLTGGAGTKCDGENNIDCLYAKIDGGTSDPGYFSKHTVTVTAAEHGTVTVNNADNIFPGDDVTFTVQPDNDYSIESVKCNDTTLTPTNGIYSFDMPFEDVTITVSFKKLIQPIDYIGENGAKLTTRDYTILTGNETELAAGCYAVKSNIAFNSAITMNGDVDIILCDGFTCTLNAPLDANGFTLNVYGQEAQTGKLKSDITGSCICNLESYKQYSGAVDLRTTNGNAIYAADNGTFKLAGGTLNVSTYATADFNSNIYAIFIPGSVDITGGTLNSVCTGDDGYTKYSYPFCCDDSDAAISNAKVTLDCQTKNGYGIYIFNDLTITDSEFTARSPVNTVYCSYGNMTIKDSVIDAENVNDNNTYELDVINAHKGVTIDCSTVKAVAKACDGFSGYVYGIKSISSELGKVIITESDVTVDLKGQKSIGVQGTKDVTITDSEVTVNGTVYAVVSTQGKLTSKDSTINAAIENTSYYSDVYAIYGSNGVTIDGGTVKAVCTGSESFSSWAYGIRSFSDIEITGAVVTADIRTKNGYGIYSSEDMTITDSKVTANGTHYALAATSGKLTSKDSTINAAIENTAYNDNVSAIVGQTGVTIDGGTVKAVCTASDSFTYWGYGIHSSSTMEITGADVTADVRTNKGYGIHSNGDLTITGGNITAVGDLFGAIWSNIGKITLGYINGSDSICASSYSSNVEIAQGQAFTNGTDIYSEGAVDKDLIAGKTLVPYDGAGTALAGYSLILGDDIGVNFFMELSPSVLNSSNVRMHFTIPDNNSTSEIDVPLSNAAAQTVGTKTYYIFPCHVAAKEMTSEIKAQLVYENDSGTNYGLEYSYNVKKYADYIINHPDEYGDKAVDLVKSMLYYGGAAQELFGFRTNDPAGADLENYVPAEIPTEGFEECGLSNVNSTANEVGLKLSHVSLILESKTTLRLYFTKTDDRTLPVLIDSNNTVYTAIEKNGEYYYDITGFSAGEVFAERTVQFAADGTTAFTDNETKFVVSVGDYCNWAVNTSGDENLANTVKALYNYDKCAQAYEEAQEGLGN